MRLLYLNEELTESNVQNIYHVKSASHSDWYALLHEEMFAQGVDCPLVGGAGNGEVL